MAPIKGSTKLYKSLDKLYYSPNGSGSFGGVQRLFKAAKAEGLKVNEKLIQNYLSRQATYTLHKPARKNFKRNPTVVGGIDNQWQADLADMKALSKANSGIKYLLTVIDVFSKYAWVIPVKSKSGSDILKGFRQLLKISKPRKPEKLQTDAGKEFLNKPLQEFFKSNGIHHFCSHSDKKAAVVERFNRTLKTRMWAYFTARHTKKYLPKLGDFVNSYNHSFHRSIGMDPINVSTKDEDKIWLKLYGANSKSKTIKGKPPLDGKRVRISKVKEIFHKGYLPNWSEEDFVVKSETRKGKPVYKLKDKFGEDIKGEFYPEEVQPIEQNEYRIEKVLQKRKAGKGIKEYFIKWKGWPSKFNSWISEKDFSILRKWRPARNLC